MNRLICALCLSDEVWRINLDPNERVIVVPHVLDYPEAVTIFEGKAVCLSHYAQYLRKDTRKNVTFFFGGG